MAEVCRVCRDDIPSHSLNANGHRFHKDCFICHECLRPFPDDSFYPSPDGQNLYCEQDFFKLHGDRCARCGELIQERLVTALDLKWHAEHFTCDHCGKALSGTSYFKREGRPFCKECNIKLKTEEQMAMKNECPRCRKPIQSKEPSLLYHGELHHAAHFTCAVCKKQLDSDFKEIEGKFYCAQDFLVATAPPCYVCKKPIMGRVTTAMGKNFHPEHFVCSKCETPFATSSFWEYQGKPYCEVHYNELAGSRCGRCYNYTRGSVVSMLGRKWCENHFSCFGCDKSLAQAGSKFMEWDMKPMCAGCYQSLPTDIRRRIYNYSEIEKKSAKAQSKKK